MTEKEKSLLRYVVSAYGFLMPYHTELPFEDFAVIVRKYYDCVTNPRNRFIATFLEYLDGYIYCKEPERVGAVVWKSHFPENLKQYL